VSKYIHNLRTEVTAMNHVNHYVIKLVYTAVDPHWHLLNKTKISTYAIKLAKYLPRTIGIVYAAA
jgi:hypothetical protein